MKKAYPTPEIAAAMGLLLIHIDSLRSENTAPCSVDPDGIKFARVVRSGGVYCFVAMSDGSNKKLGAYKEGDIFMPDGWKGPAKHSRGNIFTDLSKCGRWGVEYLR